MREKLAVGKILKEQWLSPIFAASAACFALSVSYRNDLWMTIDDRTIRLVQLLGAAIAAVCALLLAWRLRPAERLCRFSFPLFLFALLFSVWMAYCLMPYSVWKGKVPLFGAVGSVPFLCVCVYCILQYIWEHHAFGLFGKADAIVVPIFAAAAFLTVVLLYCKTTVFHMAGTSGTDSYDVLFTSDSGLIYGQDCYLNANADENDLRQPYFALLALPLGAAAKLIGLCLPMFSYGYAAGLQFVQLMAIFLSGYLLADVFGFEGHRKYIAIAAYTLCFSQVFFGLLIEQYAIGVFYLLLAVFFAKRRELLSVPLCALSVGGLLTNIVLAPFCVFNKKKDEKAIAAYCKRAALGVFFLVFFMTVSGQLLQLHPALVRYRLDRYAEFPDRLPLAGCVLQYTHFVANLFLPAPAEAVAGEAYRYHLLAIDGVRAEGIALFALAIVCFFACLRERGAQICGYWILFSLALFLGMGYGTGENGVILYSHYFAWAFIGLYLCGLRKLCRAAGKGGERVFVVAGWIFVAAIAVSMIFAMRGIVEFGLQYYAA